MQKENQQKIQQSFTRLKNWCEKQNFKGWDPYDGLNSRVFQATPLRHSRFFRLALIQFFKRSPLNFRKLFLIPKDYNPKGLGLFLTGYCNLQKVQPSDENLEKIRFLAKKILELQSEGYSGACWGYNFDWQARAFFQPKYTPTVVATTFVASALLDAYEITQDKKWLETALSSKNFILNNLNRSYRDNGSFAFSYSPHDNTQVLNATLLAARLLSRIYYFTKEEELIKTARKTIAFCIDYQNADGSWPYGTLPYHNWIDSFHTGYNLECISAYRQYSGDESFAENIEKGLNFYIKNFFTPQGIPKYYHNAIYPVDIHAPAQLPATISQLNRFEDFSQRIEKVLIWTIDNMQHPAGYFYYQKKKVLSSRIPYMRWSQAWMFYALSFYHLSIY